MILLNTTENTINSVNDLMNLEGITNDVTPEESAVSFCTVITCSHEISHTDYDG